MTDIYRLVYTSKNLVRGTESEIVATVTQILEASQRNNPRVGVTGALMFNAGAFAQVLEGPRRAVEATFERIQRDERHTDVTVLQCGPTERGAFPDWSMAFVGQSATGHALWHDLAVQSGFDVARMDGDQVFSMLHTLVLEEEGLPSAPNLLMAPVTIEERPTTSFDVERVRAELFQPASQLQPKAIPESERRSANASIVPAHSMDGGGATKSAIALAVFRAALADERGRTLELRNALDEMQVALAESQERAERMMTERDLWAGRAKLLATALGQEAIQAVSGSKPDGQANASSATALTQITNCLVA